jgi:hypothetical protein
MIRTGLLLETENLRHLWNTEKELKTQSSMSAINQPVTPQVTTTKQKCKYTNGDCYCFC